MNGLSRLLSGNDLVFSLEWNKMTYERIVARMICVLSLRICSTYFLNVQRANADTDILVLLLFLSAHSDLFSSRLYASMPLCSLPYSHSLIRFRVFLLRILRIFSLKLSFFESYLFRFPTYGILARKQSIECCSRKVGKEKKSMQRE